MKESAGMVLKNRTIKKILVRNDRLKKVLIYGILSMQMMNIIRGSN